MAVWESLPALAVAAEPPAVPVLRIEAGMRTADIRRITKALVEGVNGKGRQTPVSPSPEGVADFPIATVLRAR